MDKITRAMSIIKAAADLAGTMLRHGETKGSLLAMQQDLIYANMVLEDIAEHYKLQVKSPKL